MVLDNRFRERLEADEVQVGARNNHCSTLLVEVYGLLGLDFAWVDLQHGGPSPWDTDALENLARAAELHDIGLLVRVPAVDPAMIGKVLDAGVRNVLVPEIETADEVRRAAAATRFTYDGDPGKRPSGEWRSKQWGHADDYEPSEDDEVCLGIMLETRSAVENLDSILSVAEVGFAVPGTSDLAVTYGHPNGQDHPDVREAVREIERGTDRAGIPTGALVTDAEAAVEHVEAGYDFVRIGGELEATRRVLEDRMAAFRELLEKG